MKTSRRLFRSLAFVAVSLTALPGLAPAQSKAVLTPVFNTVHNFSAQTGGRPYPGIVYTPQSGYFFGTTNTDFYDANNVHYYGSAYRLKDDGTFISVARFNGGGNGNGIGAYPSGALVPGIDAAVYGTTFGGVGDVNNNATSVFNGTIFRIDELTGAFSTLYSFGDDPNRLNGYGPLGGLVSLTDGTLYGTTTSGGTYGYGVLFSISYKGTGFKAVSLPSADYYTRSPLVAIYSNNGNHVDLYGIGSGQVYKYDTATGTLTQVAYVGASSSLGGLAVGANGNLYGMCEDGGTSGLGFIYEVTPAGAVTTLVNFDGTNGAQPFGGLLLATDGNFYGTTPRAGITSAGNQGDGTIFQLTPAGKLTTIYVSSGEVTNMQSTLTQELRDTLYLYGTGATGGPDNYGAVFTLSLNPVITSPTTASGVTGKPFSYQITATNLDSPSNPMRNEYGLLSDGYPPGLTLNGAGLLAGTPTTAGTYVVRFFAEDFFGAGDGQVTLTFAQGAPTITSAATATGNVNSAFSYQITASGAPTSYAVTGLADGLSVNQSTGLISGTPTATATLALTLTATNAKGNGSAKLALTIKGPVPVITSPRTASGKTGVAFSYQITAGENATSYGVQGLPDGVTVNPSTGLISGTPKSAGTYGMVVNAYNSEGKGSANVTLTIEQYFPVITSPTTASATVGMPFSYQIKATGSPTTYSVQSLSDGLSLNASTGVISGTPVSPGTMSLTLNAFNTAGKGTATLTLTIAQAPPVITSLLTGSGKVTTAYAYTITASRTPTSFGVTGLPAGLSVDAKSGLLSGVLQKVGTYTMTLNAYNSAGKGSATFKLTVTP